MSIIDDFESIAKNMPSAQTKAADLPDLTTLVEAGPHYGEVCGRFRWMEVAESYLKTIEKHGAIFAVRSDENGNPVSWWSWP